MTVTALPTPPSRSGAPSSFGTRYPPFLAALPLLRSELEVSAGVSQNLDFSGFTGISVTGLLSFDCLEISLLLSSTASLQLPARFQPGTAGGLLTTTGSYRIRSLGAQPLSIGQISPSVTSAGVQTVTVTGTGVRQLMLRVYRLAGTNDYIVRGEASWPLSSASFRNTRIAGMIALGAPMTRFFLHNGAAVATKALLSYRIR